MQDDIIRLRWWAIWILSSLAFWCGCIALAGYVGHSIAVSNCESAVQECTEEIEKTCPELFEYAGALEDENAKLNKRARELKEKLDDQ